MKVLKETTLKNGTKITTYETPDHTKVHCPPCVMGSKTEDQGHCIYCGKGWDYEFSPKTIEGFIINEQKPQPKNLDAFMD